MSTALPHVPTGYRLTDSDEDRARNAVYRYLEDRKTESRQAGTNAPALDYSTVQRIACHAIGLGPNELRPVELDWIDQLIGAHTGTGPYAVGPADPAAGRRGPHYRDAVDDLARRYANAGADSDDHNHRDRFEHIGACPACQHNARAASRVLAAWHDDHRARLALFTEHRDTGHNTAQPGCSSCDQEARDARASVTR